MYWAIILSQKTVVEQNNGLVGSLVGHTDIYFNKQENNFDIWTQDFPLAIKCKAMYHLYTRKDKIEKYQDNIALYAIKNSLTFL